MYNAGNFIYFKFLFSKELMFLYIIYEIV